MYLFFDTETTGLPDYNRPPGDPCQPRVCQLGAILTDAEGRTKAEVNLLIRPDGWEIPEAAAAVHGITTDDARAYGVSIGGVVNLFTRLAGMADLVVAHNVEFDDFLVRHEATLCGAKPPMFTPFCTMKATAPVLKIPGRRSPYKPPKLQEAFVYFFGRPFEGAHDAMADVRACRDVFFALKQRTAAEEPAT